MRRSWINGFNKKKKKKSSATRAGSGDVVSLCCVMIDHYSICSWKCLYHMIFQSQFNKVDQTLHLGYASLWPNGFTDLQLGHFFRTVQSRLEGVKVKTETLRLIALSCFYMLSDNYQFDKEGSIELAIFPCPGS